MEEAKTVYVLAKYKGVNGMDEKTSLDEVIAKINENLRGISQKKIRLFCHY